MEFVAVLLLIVYLVPFTVAAGRDHPRLHWILVLDLALGWTIVGWWLALCWARSEPEGRLARRLPWLHPPPPGPARRRFELLQGGAATPAASSPRSRSSHLRVAAQGADRSPPES